jgi:RNA polymerase sigma-70 factor (ECF subfamily)
MTDWEAIVREHGPMVWRTVRRLVRGEADAADCFQETFVSAFQVAEREPIRNWGGLLQRMATARALDWLRREKRRAWIGGDEALDQAASDEVSSIDRAMGDELAERLKEALVELPAQQQEVFCLRELGQMSYEEISSEMAMSVDSVGVTLHRAKKKLRELLASEVNHDGR